MESDLRCRGALNSPPPGLRPALGEPVLTVDSKFKVRECVVAWILRYSACLSRGELALLFFSCWSTENHLGVAHGSHVFAQKSIKNEIDKLAPLDPILRNVGGSRGGRPVTCDL